MMSLVSKLFLLAQARPTMPAFTSSSGALGCPVAIRLCWPGGQGKTWKGIFWTRCVSGWYGSEWLRWYLSSSRGECVLCLRRTVWWGMVWSHWTRWTLIGIGYCIIGSQAHMLFTLKGNAPFYCGLGLDCLKDWPSCNSKHMDLFREFPWLCHSVLTSRWEVKGQKCRVMYYIMLGQKSSNIVITVHLCLV